MHRLMIHAEKHSQYHLVSGSISFNRHTPAMPLLEPSSALRACQHILSDSLSHLEIPCHLDKAYESGGWID